MTDNNSNLHSIHNTQQVGQYVVHKCPVCNGWGTVSYRKLKCHACGGSGYLKIPAIGPIDIERQTENERNKTR